MTSAPSLLESCWTITGSTLIPALSGELSLAKRIVRLRLESLALTAVLFVKFSPRLGQGHGCNAVSYDFACDRLDIADAALGGNVYSAGFDDDRAINDRKIMFPVELC